VICVCKLVGCFHFAFTTIGDVRSVVERKVGLFSSGDDLL
jgi:hypothetical protein